MATIGSNKNNTINLLNCGNNIVMFTGRNLRTLYTASMAVALHLLLYGAPHVVRDQTSGMAFNEVKPFAIETDEDLGTCNRLQYGCNSQQCPPFRLHYVGCNLKSGKRQDQDNFLVVSFLRLSPMNLVIFSDNMLFQAILFQVRLFQAIAYYFRFSNSRPNAFNSGEAEPAKP